MLACLILIDTTISSFSYAEAELVVTKRSRILLPRNQLYPQLSIKYFGALLP